jgi:HEAT repeat protein
MARAPSAYFQFWSHFDNRAATWRDGGPRLDLLIRMTKVQRRRTERELLHRLTVDPTTDGWVLDALGALQSEEAVPMLRELMRGPVAEDAAIALWRISRWRGAVRVLDRVIRAQRGRDDRRPPSLTRRIEAARYLAEIGSPTAKATLREVASNGGAPLRLQRTIEGLLGTR